MNFWRTHLFPQGAFLAVMFTVLASSHIASSAEWQEIQQGESRLAIDAPGLDEGLGRFIRKKEGGHKVLLGEWTPKLGQFPRAEIFADILKGNFHWKKAPYGDLLSQTNKWAFLEDKSFLFNESGKYGNGLGRGEFMVFMIAEHKCLSFQQYWGELIGVRGTSFGSRYLLGYYCGEAGAELDRETLDEILDSVRAPR